MSDFRRQKVARFRQREVGDSGMMQSGAGGEQGRAAAVAANANGGRGRILVSSASPTSSSSAISVSNLGFDGMQQQQQLGPRLPIQQLLNKADGNEALLTAYQAGNFPGFRLASSYGLPSSSMATVQHSKQFMGFGPQHGSFQIREEAQNKVDGVEHQAMNPVHQAYMQFALQSSQQKALTDMQLQPQTTLQDVISAQMKNHAQLSSSKPSEQYALSEKQVEHKMQPPLGQRSEPKSSGQQPVIGQLAHLNSVRPVQNSLNNQRAMAAQVQAMQAWALEHNIDLSLPSNANLIAQLMPLMQSRFDSRNHASENSNVLQSSFSRQQAASPTLASEYSPQDNTSSDVSGQSGSGKARPSSSVGLTNMGAHILRQNLDNRPPNSFPVTSSGNHPLQQRSNNNRENKKSPTVSGNAMAPAYLPQQSMGSSPSIDQAKAGLPGSAAVQAQYLCQSKQVSHQTANSSGERSLGILPSAQPRKERSMGNSAPLQQRFGFTKQQMHVLKAQILAFRRLKKGDGSLPQELLQGIVPPPLEMQLPQACFPVSDQVAENVVEDHKRHLNTNKDDKNNLLPSSRYDQSMEKSSIGDGIAAPPTHKRGLITSESVPGTSAAKGDQQNTEFVVKSEKEMENGTPKASAISDSSADRGKSSSVQGSECEENRVKNSAKPCNATQSRKYHGPLFDFPFFTRKHDNFGSGMAMNNNNNFSLGYDLKDLLYDEGLEFLQKKRTEGINKIGDLLAVNLERKRIKPDLILRLQIEEKKLRLLEFQARVRDEVDQQQQEIMAMPDRNYRKFARQCERQRMDLTRQVQASQRAIKEKQLKSIFQWRKKLLEAHWASRDARTARNRGVAKSHEKMLREFSKRKDDDRNQRMEALKNNDVERYREMLLAQQTSIPGDAAERYAVLSSFLTQTEDYLHKLGSKITAAKGHQEVEEASRIAAAAARAQGLSEEEIRAAAACAGEEVMIRNQFSEMNAPKDSSSVNKYYNLAHAVNEKVVRQPSMLRAGTLRDYQLVGLQWMLSLYNNKLNGILADEMGLGKTVQVMALIAYLMEFKGHYGPHLIIVPNAVLVNWKSEFHHWLPSVSCIFYVGNKDQRSKLFSQEVSALKFNVLVTTYEFVMYDRSKLSKVDWRYIIIDEAQRMKDRDSVLARDLDRYRCQRRLLLTGTPLQNDLKELWSLLNLLLPEVFDNRKAFHDWFSQPFQKEGPTHNADDDWLETEKKVIIIHRLHQILEPFMLRRRVEDVEGSLPPKLSIVLRCRMSAIQSAIYDWIKSTGTLHVDPEEVKRKVQKNPLNPPKTYKTLNNRCMELRKACNHPLLNYPYFQDFSKHFLVRSCGKLWVLDRILMKLQRTGHRVLLFSTMTKLLDILEEYLQWRRLVYRRIDGTTSLEDRESAIVDFNSPGSDCFIFLLSIRAAGRGLNLQSADTVVIYDPDPNPKNEEQAVARAHRIGQTREVKVIYMEAVVDKISSHQKEDEFRSGGAVDMDDDFAGKDRYMGSIESLIRNNIQQYKIDMADEVINAGRFDQRTTHEERRLTLETLLHDEERYQETVHDVPSLSEVNRMIARSENEVELFDQMDEELDWAEEMMRYDQVPKWLRASSREVNATISKLSKKPSRNILYGGSVGAESGNLLADESSIAERKKGRSKVKKLLNYAELDDDNEEFSDESSEGTRYHEEDGEIEDETSGALEIAPANKGESGEGTPVCDIRCDFSQASESTKTNHILEAGSSGSSDEIRIMSSMVSPNSSQKFGSLSALDARPGSLSKRKIYELEEGEIAASGDSHMDRQHSESWVHDRDEGDDEQVMQPKVKRKRSIRLRPCQNFDWTETKRGVTKFPLQHEQSHHLLYDAQLRRDLQSVMPSECHALKTDQSESSLVRGRRILPARRSANASRLDASPRSTRLNFISVPEEDALDPLQEIWDGKTRGVSGSVNISQKMSETVQEKCKNVIGKLQRRIDKEGHQIVPLLTDLWKRSDNSGFLGGLGNYVLNFHKINNRIEKLEYSGVMDFVFDVQLMLKGAMHFFRFSHEVRTEAKKVHDLFLDIMKVVFPDCDFSEARNTVSFSVPLPTTSPLTSPKQAAVSGPVRQHKFINEVDHVGAMPKPVEDSRLRNQMPQRESRHVTREQNREDGSPLLTHPGDLVICRKRRKEREKCTVRSRTGPTDLVLTPSLPRGFRSPSLGSTPKDARPLQQQGWGNQRLQLVGVGGRVGWANPVKKTRTDSGKRRPSHL